MAAGFFRESNARGGRVEVRCLYDLVSEITSGSDDKITACILERLQGSIPGLEDAGGENTNHLQYSCPKIP